MNSDAASGKVQIVFGSPLIGEAEMLEVAHCLESGWLGTGPRVAQFEEEFRHYKSANFAVAVNSCTAALHLSLIACDIGPGDEVITTALTFCATVNAIIHTGATPVLVDVDPVTMNMDPTKVAAKITKKTRAIIPVHFGGRACDMRELHRVTLNHGIEIIEDCAHAVETETNMGRSGTVGRFGCFSFYVTKNVVTGEGGMILAKDESDANRLKTLALHGLSQDAWRRFSDDGYRHYDVVECGFKYNMMDLQAAIGIHQLRKVEKNWMRRRELHDRYSAELADLPIRLPAILSSADRHGHHLYTILIDEPIARMSRDTFLRQITKKGVGVGVHYRSIPEHSYYQRQFQWSPDNFPIARDIGRTTVSLPLSPKLTDADVRKVITSVREIFGAG